MSQRNKNHYIDHSEQVWNTMRLFVTLGANNYMTGLGYGHQFIIGKLQMHSLKTIAKKMCLFYIYQSTILKFVAIKNLNGLFASTGCPKKS